MADTSTAKDPVGERVKVEHVLSELFLRFASKDGNIKGFAGTWTFFKPDSAEESAVNSTFRCVRTYEVLDSDPVMVRFRTFNEREPTNSRACRRSQDGVFENGYQRIPSDSFFSNTMILSEAEKGEGLPSCLFWRCVAVDSRNVVRIAPGLPPKPQETTGNGVAQYPGWTPQDIALGVFAFESFIEDEDNRWSMGALYSVNTLQLLSHFCIQEHQTVLDPAEEINFATLPFKESRPRLDKDVNTWLDSGAYKGEMTEVVWDEDGEMMKLPTRPAIWSPPNPASPTHRLFRYKDCVYGYYPLQLPRVEEGSMNVFNQGARFEMGCLCREKQEFRRLILRYAPNGQATSLTKELYKPCGSFDYEKRASTSIRRSMDTRRPNAQAAQGRAEARAARLEQALRNANINSNGH